jgi:6,7-dimethyl-8-ribityllumazine synthase
MAKTLPAPPPVTKRAGRYALVASAYNEEFVAPMARQAEAELRTLEPSCHILRVEAPGSWEIPLCVEELLHAEKWDAVLALGVVFQGETAHAELIARTVTEALMELSLRHRTPIQHEVLLLRDEEQARARCLGTEINRGVEAARAAVRLSRALGELRETLGPPASLINPTNE